jgi:CheY-like chemotaxis protein
MQEKAPQLNNSENKEEKKIRILYAEDEDFVYNSMLEAFKFFYPEAEIVHVKNGTKLFEKYNSEKFDLIFTDHNMPGRDGLEVAKEIRKTNSEIPIILTSGKLREEDVGDPTIFVMSKPIGPIKIIEKMKELLQQKQESK